MNANATAPTRQRKPRPERRIRLEVRPEDNGLGIVRIWVGKEHADYFLTILPADFGRGFKVEKIGLHENEPGYHVNIDGDKKTCECKGHLRHGHCKHADGLAALIAAGQL
ncbi:MAG TPA: hypothetical protein VKA46_17230 [Gemmataceae bacterium]|nr:hypothetical protein [Gemmataceae bacterium]